MNDETQSNTEADDTGVKTPGSFWAVAVVALFWNLIGLMMYLMYANMSPEALAMLPEAQQELFIATPSWYYWAFGIAVIGGSLGSVALLLRKSLAYSLFVVSLVGVLVQNTYSFFLSDTFDVMGSTAMIMPIIVIIVSMALVWFSKTMKERGILS